METQSTYGKTTGWILGNTTYTDEYPDAVVTDSSMTATRSAIFIGTLEEALRSAPDLGTGARELDSRLRLRRRVFTENKDNTTVSLTMTYEIFSDGEEKEPQYDLARQDQTVSILFNPEYKKATNDAKVIAKALIDGADPWSRVYYRVANGKLEIRKEKPEGADWKDSILAEMADKIAEVNEVGKRLLLKIKEGQIDFQTVVYTWTETIYKKSVSNYAAHAGKIDTPPGPNPYTGSNWLYKGATATKTRSDRRFLIKREWQSSPTGEWDKELYSKQDSGM